MLNTCDIVTSSVERPGGKDADFQRATARGCRRIIRTATGNRERITPPVSGGLQGQSHAEEPSLRCGPSAPLGGEAGGIYWDCRRYQPCQPQRHVSPPQNLPYSCTPALDGGKDSGQQRMDVSHTTVGRPDNLSACLPPAAERRAGLPRSLTRSPPPSYTYANVTKPVRVYLQWGTGRVCHA